MSDTDNATVEFIRASGDCLCQTCGREYWRHPHTKHVAWDGNQWLRRLCDGTLVKL